MITKIDGYKFALSIKPISIKMQNDFDNSMIQAYRNNKDFPYMIMPKYGIGLVSKN